MLSIYLLPLSLPESPSLYYFIDGLGFRLHYIGGSALRHGDADRLRSQGTNQRLSRLANLHTGTVPLPHLSLFVCQQVARAVGADRALRGSEGQLKSGNIPRNHAN